MHLLIRIPFWLPLVLEHFKAKSITKIDTFLSSLGLQEIIKEATHLIDNLSSYIDLIFTSEPNLVMESVVHSS